jgi:DNA-binding IclR family transcriptional regulator
VFQRILRNVVENPGASFTLQEFQQLLGVPEATTRRILDDLVTAGLLAKGPHGLWARTWSHVHHGRAARPADERSL